MRTGSLLATDTLDRYQPLGAFGQPVYLSYVQLKAAVRQKLGARCANYFSRPDRDPRGQSIRWLSDVQGTAVRWRDLQHEEQVAAAMDLHEMRSAFQKYLGELRGQPGAPKEAAAFASLLENALLVPDDDHLFFVDGQPMVSFWGFRHGEGGGFDAMTVAPAAAAAAIPAVAVAAAALPVERPRHPWWLWLLGLLAFLLMLGLLLFALRWWGWLGGFGLTLPGLGSEKPVPPAVTAPDLRQPEGTVETVRPGVTIPDGTLAVPAVPVAPGIAPATPATPVAPETVAPKAAPKVEPPVPPQPQPQIKPPPPAEPPVPKPVPLPDSALRPPVPGAKLPSLVIPPESEKSGSTAFLEGWWRSGKGLVNRQDNTPLQQFYRFDRDGKGEVLVRRADGSECRAPARAVLGANGLDVTELGDPKCPDGTTIERSRTSCRRAANGQTVCSGINSDNSTYSIPVERLP